MPLLYEKESYIIRGIIFAIYKKYRNYHKEIVYHNIMISELKNNFKLVEKNKRINIIENEKIVGVYVPDIVIDGIIVIELKCKPIITMPDRRQFWHYLKCSEYRLGSLVNFGNQNGAEIERKVFDEARLSSA